VPEVIAALKAGSQQISEALGATPVGKAVSAA